MSSIKQKRKVLYVIDSLVTGGAEKSLLEIAGGLKEFVPVVAVLFDKNPDLKSRFEALNIHLVFLSVNERFWWFDGVLKLRKLIDELIPTIVHASLFKSEIVTRLAVKSDMPNVGSFVNDSYSHNRYREQTALRNLKLNVVRFFDAITANSVTHFMSVADGVSESNGKALGISMNRITTIYRGRVIAKYRQGCPATQTPFIFLVVARLIMRKGYMQLFEAAEILDSRGFDFKIRIAGVGADAEKLISMVSAFKIEKRIEFLGNRNDVPDLLADSHCFVFPSHYEGLGGALIEAMLAAKPIIVSDIRVFTEQIVDRKTGLIFPVFNSQGLALKMEWMIEHYESGIEMGLALRDEAVKKFDINNAVALHEKLYNDILDRPRNYRRL